MKIARHLLKKFCNVQSALYPQSAPGLQSAVCSPQFAFYTDRCAYCTLSEVHVVYLFGCYIILVVPGARSIFPNLCVTWHYNREPRGLGCRLCFWQLNVFLFGFFFFAVLLSTFRALVITFCLNGRTHIQMFVSAYITDTSSSTYMKLFVATVT